MHRGQDPATAAWPVAQQQLPPADLRRAPAPAEPHLSTGQQPGALQSHPSDCAARAGAVAAEDRRPEWRAGLQLQGAGDHAPTALHALPAAAVCRQRDPGEAAASSRGRWQGGQHLRPHLHQARGHQARPALPDAL